MQATLNALPHAGLAPTYTDLLIILLVVSSAIAIIVKNIQSIFSYLYRTIIFMHQFAYIVARLARLCFDRTFKPMDQTSRTRFARICSWWSPFVIGLLTGIIVLFLLGATNRLEWMRHDNDLDKTSERRTWEHEACCLFREQEPWTQPVSASASVETCIHDALLPGKAWAC